MLAQLLLAWLGLALGKSTVVVPGWVTMPPFLSAATVSNGGVIQISGMNGIDFTSLSMVEGGLGPQMDKTLANVKEIMEAAGATVGDLLECTIYLSSDLDPAEVATHMDKYTAFFTGYTAPARAVINAGLGPGAAVEIKCSGELPGYKPLLVAAARAEPAPLSAGPSLSLVAAVSAVTLAFAAVAAMIHSAKKREAAASISSPVSLA